MTKDKTKLEQRLAELNERIAIPFRFAYAIKPVYLPTGVSDIRQAAMHFDYPRDWSRDLGPAIAQLGNTQVKGIAKAVESYHKALDLIESQGPNLNVENLEDLNNDNTLWRVVLSIGSVDHRSLLSPFIPTYDNIMRSYRLTETQLNLVVAGALHSGHTGTRKYESHNATEDTKQRIIGALQESKECSRGYSASPLQNQTYYNGEGFIIYLKKDIKNIDKVLHGFKDIFKVWCRSISIPIPQGSCDDDGFPAWSWIVNSRSSGYPSISKYVLYENTQFDQHCRQVLQPMSEGYTIIQRPLKAAAEKAEKAFRSEYMRQAAELNAKLCKEAKASLAGKTY